VNAKKTALVDQHPMLVNQHSDAPEIAIRIDIRQPGPVQLLDGFMELLIHQYGFILLTLDEIIQAV